MSEWVKTAVAGTGQVGIARIGYLLVLWLLLHHTVNFEQSMVLILLGVVLEGSPEATSRPRRKRRYDRSNINLRLEKS